MIKVILALLVLLGLKVILVQLVQLALKVTRVTRVTRVKKETLALLVLHTPCHLPVRQSAVLRRGRRLLLPQRKQC